MSEHRTLREAVDALAEEWERDEAYACRNAAECTRCTSFQRVVIRLRNVLAAHPDPPAPTGQPLTDDEREACPVRWCAYPTPHTHAAGADAPTFDGLLSDPTQQLDKEGVVMASVLAHQDADPETVPTMPDIERVLALTTAEREWLDDSMMRGFDALVHTVERIITARTGRTSAPVGEQPDKARRVLAATGHTLLQGHVLRGAQWMSECACGETFRGVGQHRAHQQAEGERIVAAREQAAADRARAEAGERIAQTIEDSVGTEPRLMHVVDWVEGVEYAARIARADALAAVDTCSPRSTCDGGAEG